MSTNLDADRWLDMIKKGTILPEKDLRMLCEKIKEILIEESNVQPVQAPVIICGDFNDTPMSYTYNQFNKGLVDAFRNASFGIGTSYVGKIPAGRIDYIFHSPSLFSSNFTIQKEVLSDHRAVSCIISK